MNIREAILSVLRADTALVAILGARMSSSFAPVNTPAELTWLVMTKVAGNEEASLDGNSDLSHPIFQFTIGGPDKTKVDEVQRLLCNLHGNEFRYEAQAPHYRVIFQHRDDRDLDWDSNERLFKCSVDFEIWFQPIETV